MKLGTKIPTVSKNAIKVQFALKQVPLLIKCCYRCWHICIILGLQSLRTFKGHPVSIYKVLSRLHDESFYI